MRGHTVRPHGNRQQQQQHQPCGRWHFEQRERQGQQQWWYKGGGGGGAADGGGAAGQQQRAQQPCYHHPPTQGQCPDGQPLLLERALAAVPHLPLMRYADLSPGLAVNTAAALAVDSG
ncbi:unnamed protein product [Closterium sp. Naga37s-1]|nr:unnamed protein product [Closterium sp. Naga37s-1]